jgi:hypothetical protein
LLPFVRAAVMTLALIAIAGASTGTEAWHSCPGNGWEVTGTDDHERALVCEGVAGATAFLSSCGVVGTAATRVRVVDALPLSCGVKVWGLFDAASDEIVLGNPAICLADAPDESLFRLISAPLAFVSIAAHEATHAMLHARGLGAERRLEHEYIAAVVQMRVLPEAAREAVLAPLKLGATVDLWELNPLILALRPELFAGLAWQHFENANNNCAFIRALAEGTLRLPDYSAF